jgi:hypothetical protein
MGDVGWAYPAHILMGWAISPFNLDLSNQCCLSSSIFQTFSDLYEKHQIKKTRKKLYTDLT